MKSTSSDEFNRKLLLLPVDLQSDAAVTVSGCWNSENKAWSSHLDEAGCSLNTPVAGLFLMHMFIYLNLFQVLIYKMGNQEYPYMEEKTSLNEFYKDGSNGDVSIDSDVRFLVGRRIWHAKSKMVQILEALFPLFWTFCVMFGFRKLNLTRTGWHSRGRFGMVPY